MILRVASVVGVLLVGFVIGLMIDLGAPGQALAQYYPPPPPTLSAPIVSAAGLSQSATAAAGASRAGRRPGCARTAADLRLPGQPAAAARGPVRGSRHLSAGFRSLCAGIGLSEQRSATGLRRARPGRPGRCGSPADVDRTGSRQQPQGGQGGIAALPPDYQPETGPAQALPPQFRRTLVDYRTKEPAGTIIIDTPNTYLYLVLGNGKAMRYGIGVGREGFTWAGTERISRMAQWPDWRPPPEMIERQPYLPRFMAGGESNPLGARALYLGKTEYRIHGTNQPSTIGSFVSSGCIRLTNEDVTDLYGRVQVGTRVVVMPGTPPDTAQATPIGRPIESSPLPPPGVRTR